MNLSVLVNHRLPGESAVAFRERRRHFNRVLKRYLQRGKPATAPRKKDGAPPMIYVPGPHRSHQPHEVTAEGFITGPAGAPVEHTFRVLHPGTLVKQVRA